MPNLITIYNDLVKILGPIPLSEEMLNFCIQEAVAEHSYLFPRRDRVIHAVDAGQQEVGFWFNHPPIEALDLVPATAITLIGVTQVECPPGTLLPYDPGRTTDPAGTRPPATSQGYRVVDTILYLTNPASGLEVGSATLIIEVLLTYNMPDVLNAVSWDGTDSDYPFLLLLAERRAYNSLAGRLSYTDPPTDNSAALAAVAAFDAQIAEAIKARQRRGLASRTLDI